MKKIILFIIFGAAIYSCKTNSSFSLSDQSFKKGAICNNYTILFYFAVDSILMEQSKPTLDSIYTILNVNQDLKMEIGVHTILRGDENANLVLSQKRANKLKEYFVSVGIKEGRLVAKGYGETKPLEPEKKSRTTSSHGKAKEVNRRVSLKIL